MLYGRIGHYMNVTAKLQRTSVGQIFDIFYACLVTKHVIFFYKSVKFVKEMHILCQ
jgi:hypothetical protein